MKKLEFEVKKDKHGRLHVPCKAEKKGDGSIVMHAPSPKAMMDTMMKYKEKEKKEKKNG